MPTDTERREVAARLRKAIGLTEFAEVLGFNWTDDSDWVWNDVSNLVADLIEPPLQCPYYRSDRHYCSAYDDVVDRDALLALAKVLGGMGDRYNEHGRYELGTTFKAIAERIREALGVSDD